MKTPLTDAQKRVQIAVDVVENLKSRFLEARTGFFVMGRAVEKIRTDAFTDEKKGNTSVRTYLKRTLKTVEPCAVCAKGALFISHILRHNKITYNEFYRTSEHNDSLNERMPYFPEKMLAEIETLYEGKEYNWNSGYFTVAESNSILRYSRSKLCMLASEKRLITIMELLIENKGEKVIL